MSFSLNAQEKHCIEYKSEGFCTGPHPKTSPIFPGCEAFKENNDSLNRCFGDKVANKIAEKLEMKISKNIDSANIFKTKLIIRVGTSGKLSMYLINKVNNKFENQLVEKLNEISDETTGIIPAKYEGNYCALFNYGLPLLFNLKEWNEN